MGVTAPLDLSASSPCRGAGGEIAYLLFTGGAEPCTHHSKSGHRFGRQRSGKDRRAQWPRQKGDRNRALGTAKGIRHAVAGVRWDRLTVSRMVAGNLGGGTDAAGIGTLYP